MAVLTGGSSNFAARLTRLVGQLPALLQGRPGRIKHQPPRQVQRRLTPAQARQLVVEYQAGDDMKVLAARWSLHRTTVAALLRRGGVELRRQGVPEEKLTEAVRLYADGWSCRLLGERYGCDAETVRQSFVRANVHLRQPWERL